MSSPAPSPSPRSPPRESAAVPSHRPIASRIASKTADQVARATQRLAQLKARQLLQEMRAAAKARNKARRVQYQRRLELGAAVISAGCGEWRPEHVVGVLVEHRAHVEASPTVRAWFGQRGREFLDAGRKADSIGFPPDEAKVGADAPMVQTQPRAAIDTSRSAPMTK